MRQLVSSGPGALPVPHSPRVAMTAAAMRLPPHPSTAFRQLKDHPAQPTTPATCGITGASARLLQVLHVHGPFVALCISLAGTASNCTVAAQPSTDLCLWRPSTDWLSACFILEILHCSAVACCGDWCGDWTARLGRPPQLSSGHALSGNYVLRTLCHRRRRPVWYG